MPQGMRTSDPSRPGGRRHPVGVVPEARTQAALLAALERFRSNGEDLHEAAEAEGVAAWRVLEAAQAMPAPGADGLEDNGLEPFVRKR